MTVYYNEFDLTAAQWLENLIKAGHIAAGVVDRRSILDVRPNDLRGFAQCHFFAGIGVWSYALRAAGWPDDRSVWTGSCPCQPFSAAGDGAGFADERHLWPAFCHLISEHEKWCRQQKRRAPVIFGEQVASKDADPWIDLVQADLEALGYAFGAVAFPSAGIGAPHIRDRSYWVAHTEHGRRETGQPQRTWPGAVVPSGVAGGMVYTDGMDAGTERQQRSGEQRQQPQDGCAVRLGHADSESTGRITGSACGAQVEIYGKIACHGNGSGHAGNDVLRLADATISGRREERADARGIAIGDSSQRIATGPVHGGADHRPGPTNGFWRDVDWLGCRDGKWRPVEPGSFPLAHGVAGRVGSLRGYGNAINAEQARIFIECVMECRP